VFQAGAQGVEVRHCRGDDDTIRALRGSVTTGVDYDTVRALRVWVTTGTRNDTVGALGAESHWG